MGRDHSGSCGSLLNFGTISVFLECATLGILILVNRLMVLSTIQLMINYSSGN